MARRFGLGNGFLLGLVAFYAQDIFMAAYVLIIFSIGPSMGINMFYYLVAGIVIFITIRTLLLFLARRFYLINRINIIKEITSEFKKGRFITRINNISGDDEFARVLRDLVMVGKQLEKIVSTQRNEIDTFHELYNSMVFSISSYFVVLDEDDHVVYANEAFCRKFKVEQTEMGGKTLDEIFYFVNARLRSGIRQARGGGKTIVLERIHLLSLQKVSVISDVKIIKMVVQGRNQIIIIIDDVTSRLRKDYQISIMSQISESIQRDVEIERVLHTILTGITSGSGLGFNRAQLFLVEDDILVGKMAVGPDSFEEAIDIWSTVGSTPYHIQDAVQEESGHVSRFLARVLGVRMPLSVDNIFTRALNDMTSIHVYDSVNDPQVDAEIREFMDVREFVIAPIIAVNKPIGIVVVDNKFNLMPIGNDSIELLTIFASQAALSIESHGSLVRVRREMEKIERRQDAIVESEKMAAVGRIAAHISHEIRNPLVTMGGYARRILQLTRDIEKNSGNIKKSANIILKESERLEKILSNVMDFTRPSKYIKEFSNINDVVADTYNLLKNLFLERRIDFIMKLKEDLPLVKSDSNQMKQVMLNLFQNAVDVTPPGGTIEVTTYNVDESIIIVVTDTGSGIAGEDPDVVFEPFFTTKVTGIGLGLANVKKIIMDHNGTIAARNRPEGGAEFEIRLPCPA